MLDALPGWVVDDERSVREEVREWIGTTAAARWHIARLCSRDVMWAVSVSPDPRRVLDQVDPLPPSTVSALARLRGQAGWGHGTP